MTATRRSQPPPGDEHRHADARCSRAAPSLLNLSERKTRAGAVVERDPVHPNPFGDILDPLLTSKLEANGQLVLDVIVRGAGDDDAAGFGQAFETRGNVHAIAEQVVLLGDHVAEVDPDAEIDALVRRDAGVALGHGALDRQRAVEGIDHARELGQQAVAHQLDDAPPVRGDGRSDQLILVLLERGVSSDSSLPISRE